MRPKPLFPAKNLMVLDRSQGAFRLKPLKKTLLLGCIQGAPMVLLVWGYEPFAQPVRAHSSKTTGAGTANTATVGNRRRFLRGGLFTALRRRLR
jgi:hypothetical protein